MSRRLKRIVCKNGKHEMTPPNNVPGQISAIATLRWRLFVNGLRSKRGKMELASRIIVASAFALGGFGGFAAATGFAWYFAQEGRAEFLAILFWAAFFFLEGFFGVG